MACRECHVPQISVCAAHDVNEELTIIFNAAMRSMAAMDAGDPSLLLVRDIRDAALRCAWKAAILLDWCRRQGIHPTPAPLHELTEVPLEPVH